MSSAANGQNGAQSVSLKLFVTGRTPGAMRARQAVESLLEIRSGEGIHLKIVDVLADPNAALTDNVYATPTIIRTGGGIERRLIGDLSSVEKLEIGLLLEAAA
ncbi:MAG: circadian clock protein KaiB [Rhodospirillaceae bacterium]|jgi:circadian clock protein KaiB|nr:circadian clock protein KaiB [Rhodospirillaceae bacterium]MBT5242109.1 circadian clock protein KaiB [Rhodospirillaceae bacterium]MBT5565835.1 circadian clock protein KaiB [Rhodospirillaceae bacterium]MBT6090272.1 circadian clock protein KaiB [Rhodospirillaceae bacterium]MBT6960860.1 circadian clock protein KaiB [Rhodospirillaceae bacterium]